MELRKTKQQLFKEMANSKIKIMGIEESLKTIKEEKKSICRLGDGELDIILGGKIGFQRYDKRLAKMLEEILTTKQDFCLVGVPDAINHFDNITKESKEFWTNNMLRVRDTWMKYLNEDMDYCTANITRLYIRYEDKSNCGKYFSMLKDIWNNRDVVICEGEQTRVGVGNDLLANCKTVKRVICPAENAFDKYDEILKILKKENKDTLFLIALGPTATLLAYNLAKDGYQALDVGHFDIEYEWFKRGVTKKEKIENKYTNEVVGGNNAENILDTEYLSQIKTVIK